MKIKKKFLIVWYNVWYNKSKLNSKIKEIRWSQPYQIHVRAYSEKQARDLFHKTYQKTHTNDFIVSVFSISDLRCMHKELLTCTAFWPALDCSRD